MENLGRRNINRKPEPLPIDEWLKSEGYFRKAGPKDPACLFRAVSEQIYNAQFYYIKVRRECVEFMRKQRHLFEHNKDAGDSFDNYLEKLLKVKEWAGMMEIEAMSLLYKRDFVIFLGGHNTPLKKKIVINNGFDKIIYLCHTPPRHYETVYKSEIIATAAFCQSIVYKILYKDVFKLPDVDHTVDKMLHDYGPHDERDNQLSVPPFSYRIAKALDPNIYRNTDYDIWFELRRQVRTTRLLHWNNNRLQIGGKCLVRINPEEVNIHGQFYNHGNKYNNPRMFNRGEPLMFTAHIQDMAPNEGPVVVFILELGEIRTVSFRSLIPWREQNNNLPAIMPSPPKNKHDDQSKLKKQQFNGYRKAKDLRSPPMSMRFGANDKENINRNGHKTSPSKNNCANNFGNKNSKEFVKNEPQKKTSSQVPSQVPVDNLKLNLNETRDFENKNNCVEDNKKYVENKNGSCEVEEKKVFQPQEIFPAPNGEFTPCNDMNTICVQPVQETCNGFANPYCEEKNFVEYQSLPPVSLINYSNQIINYRVAPSFELNGNDLPFSDISTLRYFFNLGLECFHMNHRVWWPNNDIPYPVAPPNTPISPPPSPPRSFNVIPSENPQIPVVEQCYAPVPMVNENLTQQQHDNVEYHKNYSPNKQKPQQRYISSENPNENSSFKHQSKKKSPNNSNKFLIKPKNEQNINYNGNNFKYVQGYNENHKEFNPTGDSARKNQLGRFKKNNQGYQNRPEGKSNVQNDHQKLYNNSQEENYPKRFDKKNLHECQQQQTQPAALELQNQSPPNNCGTSHPINLPNGPYYPNEPNNNVYGSPQGNIYPAPYVSHSNDIPQEVNNFPPMVMYNPGNYPQHLPPMYPPVMYPPPLVPHMTSIYPNLPSQNSQANWCVSNGQPGCIPYTYLVSQPNEPLLQIKK